MVSYFSNHATAFKAFVPLCPPNLEEDNSGRPERQMQGKYPLYLVTISDTGMQDDPSTCCLNSMLLHTGKY
jgi:hypothetical protein